MCCGLRVSAQGSETGGGDGGLGGAHCVGVAGCSGHTQDTARHKAPVITHGVGRSSGQISQASTDTHHTGHPGGV